MSVSVTAINSIWVLSSGEKRQTAESRKQVSVSIFTQQDYKNHPLQTNLLLQQVTIHACHSPKDNTDHSTSSEDTTAHDILIGVITTVKIMKK